MPIAIGIIYAVILFTVQTLLFKKTEKSLIHIIPIAAIALVYITALCMPFLDAIMSELGRNDGYSFYSFLAMLTAVINTAGLIAVGVAWLVWKL